jgi:phosphatidylinositol alpha-1,6-mannosyltransferase
MTRPDLLLTFDFPPIGGGIARWMSEIALRYPAGELVVSTGRLPGDLASDARFPNRIDRVEVPSRRLKTFLGQIRWARRALGLERRSGFRFAWCDNIRPSAYPANVLWRRRGVAYGVIVHGSDLFDLRANYRRSRLKRLVARRLLGDAAAIVTTSGWTRDRLIEVLGELNLDRIVARIRTVPLGTDPSRFRPEVDPTAFRVERQLPEGRWIVTVARLEPHKGIDTTIRALRLLAAEYPDLRYAVAGEGSFRAGAESLARALGITDRVHFLSTVPDESLPAVYGLATVYCGISRQTEHDAEGFGIALLEAQSSGKPVVAGRSGGIADAVSEGETGLLVDPTDAQAVAAAVKGLLDHPDRAQALGRAGRLAVERHLNWDRVVQDLRAIAAERGQSVSSARDTSPA